MIDALLAALKNLPRFANLTAEDLEPLPATGTAHGHVSLPGGLIARVAYAYEGDAAAAARLETQAAAFRLLAPSKCTPALHDIVEPRPGLPGGALIVDRIDGQVPTLPRDLGAIAASLAAIHSLKKPPATSPIPRQKNPFLETLEVIEQGALRFLDKAVPDQGARAEIAEELRLMRGMALAIAKRPQPLTIALADTHPGNFIMTPDGTAWFVDLEKVHVGSPAIDLAHATLPTSTLWHPEVGKILTPGQVAGFYAHYLARIGKTRAAALEPWLVPMRRLTWLRTTMFMARWRVQTSQARDPDDPGQWSDAGLEPAMRAHLKSRIDQCFDRETIRAIRAEWL
ncbi:MAG: aminoglycoside phosphotransferase [Reyranella sp.]|uniref:phosphotransferase n=1 Tax=Reyranella sp. TaxID=1929291 RepID=UPI00121AA619|nr:phosphotransferase [Reyranella sp.]TAJ41511.1 MAG: aminoglycoside phosphotransferase [Reyranella sp.]